MKTTAVGDRNCIGLRGYLQRELARRCAENPQYSLRAFAKSLGTDHSTLSQILRHRRRLTSDTIRSLSRQLGLSVEDIEQFVSYEEHLGGEQASERHVRQLQAEAVEIISQWHHFAILELTRLESFLPDCRWIARVLDIAVDEVNRAVTRLLHLGLLRMLDEQTWLDTSENAFVQFDQLPSAVARELAARIARLTNPSGIADRVVSSSTVAVDRKRLSVVANYLEKVRHDLNDLLRDQRTTCDDVYQLDILLYPLTTLHQEKNHGTAGNSVSNPRQEPRAGRRVLRQALRLEDR